MKLSKRKGLEAEERERDRDRAAKDAVWCDGCEKKKTSLLLVEEIDSANVLQELLRLLKPLSYKSFIQNDFGVCAKAFQVVRVNTSERVV